MDKRHFSISATVNLGQEYACRPTRRCAKIYLARDVYFSHNRYMVHVVSFSLSLNSPAPRTKLHTEVSQKDPPLGGGGQSYWSLFLLNGSRLEPKHRLGHLRLGAARQTSQLPTLARVNSVCVVRRGGGRQKETAANKKPRPESGWSPGGTGARGRKISRRGREGSRKTNYERKKNFDLAGTS